MSELPSTTRTLVRGLLRRRPGLIGHPIPRLEARASGIRVDPQWLERYRGLTDDAPGAHLPAMAPQLLAGPLHAQILADKRMPVGVLGLVHVRQQIRQQRPLPADAPLDIEVWLEGHRPARQGAELDVHTRVSLNGEPEWEGITTALSRGPWKDETAEGAPDEHDALPEEGQELWDVAEDIGRRWRQVAGDPNPIHLHRLLARPFGFKAAIAHGTWLLARALAHAGSPADAVRIDARFRRPVFLPSQAAFRVQDLGQDTRFELRDPARDKVHLQGTTCSL